jgi:hypothetical protein
MQFLIIYVLSQQLYGQLQTAQCTYNYVVEQHNTVKVNYRKSLEKIQIQNIIIIIIIIIIMVKECKLSCILDMCEINFFSSR